MSKVYVVGIGMTPCGKMPHQSIKSLTDAAVREALRDAGMEVQDVESAFFSNATQSVLEGQHMIAGQVALRSMGFGNIPIINIENACASGSTAFHLACSQVRSGEVDVALAAGAEKMYHPDRRKMFSVFDGALDVHDTAAIMETLAMLGRGLGDAPDEAATAGERSVFMDVYAAMAKLHMKLHGSTQRQLAAITSKNHGHSQHNELAQFRNPLSIEDVLAARVISWPLTLPMCAPVSDGAAAAVVVSEAGLKRFAGRRAVEVLASVVMSGSDRAYDDYEAHVCRRAAQKAYRIAGIGPQDVSVAEVHDATAYAELLQTELLGFAEIGQGGWLAERGETTIGGSIPVNPSGGLVSKGHPIGATGLGQIHELVLQLRGAAGVRQVENARIGLAENGGGFIGYEEAVTSVNIFGRVG